MKIENPTAWPFDQWPRFIEILRAFCLSDEEQDAFFPELVEPRYHASNEGDGYTLCSYSPALSDGYDLAASYLIGCWGEDEDAEEMFERIATQFRKAQDEVLELPETRVFPYAPHTNRIGLQKVRPELRTLCSQALAFFGEELRAPTSWQELLF